MDTIDTVEKAQIPYVGAGRNLQEAMKPVYFIANGRKIAIVSATQIERSLNYTREATEERAGVLKTLNPEIDIACKIQNNLIFSGTGLIIYLFQIMIHIFKRAAIFDPQDMKGFSGNLIPALHILHILLC